METEPTLRILSLGAGWQSTTMALMAADGLIGPMPDAAIFADTQDEPRAVYEHLARLEAVLPFPVIRVSKGNIRESFYRAQSTGKRYAMLPVFVRNADGSVGMGRRQCTKEFKLEPIGKAVRALMAERGVRRSAGAVEQWIGISLDEVVRMKPARVRYVRHRWPLIEERMSRHDCGRWLQANWVERYGYPMPPKSACKVCPYHGDAQWRALRDGDPAEWAEVVEFDRAIRDGGPRGLLIGKNYLHRSCLPIDEVDFSTAEERGQGTCSMISRPNAKGCAESEPYRTITINP